MAEPRDSESAHEFRLEGLGLILTIALLIGVLAGTFYLGVLYGRSSVAVASTALTPSDPLAHVAVTEAPIDVGEKIDYFDTLEGGEKQLESERQARVPSPPKAAKTPETKPPEPDPRPAAEPQAIAAVAAVGDYFVQVFAGRDRRAAEGLVDRLKGGGFRVRLVSETEGRDALVRVQVGGYPTEDGAREVAQKLQKQGYPDAWVTHTR